MKYEKKSILGKSNCIYQKGHFFRMMVKNKASPIFIAFFSNFCPQRSSFYFILPDTYVLFCKIYLGLVIWLKKDLMTQRKKSYTTKYLHMLHFQN